MSTTPRRVLYVENGIGYGGAAICLRHLVRGLDRSRFEPLVVTGRTGPTYQDMANDGPWKYIPDRHLDVVGLRTRLDAATWPDRVPGLRALVMQCLARLDDAANFLPFFLRLTWTAWRFGADLVHANNEPLCNRAALLAGKVLRIPIVCHVRGDQQGSRSMRWWYRLPDHFVPVSHWVSAGIGELGVPADKRTVVYDGIALDKLDPGADPAPFRRQWQIADDAFAVGLVGLLIPWKGQRLFLEAARLLRERIPRLRMLIVGGTPEDCREYEADLRATVDKEGLAEIVTFTGHASDMQAVYAGLDVVVSASTSPEPLGTVVIESMTMARPLVGPNHGGAAEMAEHERSALLFTPGDAASLATAIARLHGDPALRRRLGTAARERALNLFAIERHAAEVQTIYDALMTNRHG